MSKLDVLRHVEKERQFQDAKWGPIDGGGGHTLGEWVLLMESELEEAKRALVKGGEGRNAIRSEIIQVLAVGLSIVEDPTRKRIGGSRPFDGEGLPVATRHLVKDGILQSWTLDLATARQLGLQSTGNASRGTSSPPSPGAGNLELTQGNKTKADLLADMGTGLLITSLIGSSINPTTGDYSRGASGFWVENGQITGPVNECTIAGNLRDMLKRIIPANDARAHLSRVVPSLLVEGLMLAGA